MLHLDILEKKAHETRHRGVEVSHIVHIEMAPSLIGVSITEKLRYWPSPFPSLGPRSIEK